MPNPDAPAPPRLAWDICALIRVGHRRAAAETLAAQRRITFEAALALVDEWREAHGF
jgi:hypothetical protein